ncbi:hypothetical protein GCM10020367_63860 [Streptomyces sannanensis]|uniref:Uncharacterized protein n=1 Tax=Streptomyces sannanensis TaxID=285536 RepID=A0ABP6SLK9_9ACTN
MLLSPSHFRVQVSQATHEPPSEFIPTASGKIPELSQALTGRFREHYAFLTRLYLAQYDHLSGAINQLTARIEEAVTPFARHWTCWTRSRE